MLTHWRIAAKARGITMTFDMTKCKIGDKLKTRAGDKVELTDVDAGDFADSFVIDNEYSVKQDGRVFNYDQCAGDIIGFWEEDASPQEPTEEDEQSFPNIEKRIPYVVKTVTYRIHFNELYSRDITSDEAEAIYEQLKTLLGK